jgi:hypothetical protein
MEKYQARIKSLQQLTDAGLINLETFFRAQDQAEKDLRGQDTALDVGTFQTIRTKYVDLAGLNMSQNEEPVVKALDENKTVLEAVRDNVKIIADNSREPLR